MRAIRIHSHGGPDVLQYDSIDEPLCPPDKVKVQIKAAALNHLDLWIRQGLPGFSLPLPLVMGSDGAGIITEVGSEVKDLQSGDKVVIQPNLFCGHCPQCVQNRENFCTSYGILGETQDGVQCEYIVLSPENIYPAADHLTFSEAASMPLVFLTAYQMLVTRARIQAGETVLVYGATSGVGSAGIQIAKQAGCIVLTTVGHPDKIDYALSLGADHVVDHCSTDWVSKIKRITGRPGVQVVFEHIGAATWESSMRLLGFGGRLVTCGATTGAEANIQLQHLFFKQQTLMGSTMSDYGTFKEVMTKINAGIYKPFVDQVFLFSEVVKAHQRLEDRHQFGKIVLIPE